LGGIAAGWGSAPRRDVAAAAILSAVAIAPDLDLLVSTHRAETHSIGAAVIAGAVAWVVARSVVAAAPLPPAPGLRRTGRRDALSWAVAVTLAWASHVLLDWLSNDTRPPFGIMALWPLTREYYKASVELFPATSRQYWLAEFWIDNLKAVVVETAILGPIAAVVIWWRRGQTGVRPLGV
jgi:hypothetical protein